MAVESEPGTPLVPLPFSPLGSLAKLGVRQAPLLPPEEDPRWFQRAVFYEVLIRGFFDGNNDGVGDIPGLIAKLDYLQWLGVDCLWLLPFYPSPLRDGGYDISDFYSVHPESGTVEDLRRLLDESHARGIRVIADLVINHTSDQHPWFVESRQSRDNPKADWYVWNDDDQRWPEARVVFIDVERSNWSFDSDRNQYDWHRFYAHQPDLNYENPEVADAMLDVVRFWLDLGLDGFRLDAVPFLFQRDGTAGENLPETHAFIRRVRAELDTNYPGRILLAEANGWPADVADYFGDDDECHLCFNFPLMPRLFMAVRREQSYPITEILAQTPEAPGSSQWAIFLRNHDELTLEMVTEEERDYLFGEYAKDPRMKRHMGIGRRLAPLLDRDRRLSELLHHLLFTLPGSPVLYYGDEIQMGDNLIWATAIGAHSDAVDPGPQRRLQPGRLRPAVPAASDGPGLWVLSRERRGPTTQPELVPRLDATDSGRSPRVPGARDRRARGDLLGQPLGVGLRSIGSGPRRPGAGQPGALRAQPQSAGPTRRAARGAVGGPPAHRAVGAGRLPVDRSQPLPGHAGVVRLSLLRAGLIGSGPAAAFPGRSARFSRRRETGTRTASSSAACSGFTMLMSTPVPSSKPATVVIFGTTWTCQW